MIKSIRKRLQAIEHINKQPDAPDLVFISWNGKEKCWIAKEQYMKRGLNEKIIPHRVKEKIIRLNDPSDYEPPEGFKGNVYIEGDME